MSKETRVGWIVIETPIEGKAGEFYVSTLFKSEKETDQFERKKGYCYDVIPLHWFQKSEEEVDAIMDRIYAPWRKRWCGGENGGCACMGCVQIDNRRIMVEAAKNEKFYGDPEYIDESNIPEEIYNKYKVTKDEWLNWMERHPDEPDVKQPWKIDLK